MISKRSFLSSSKTYIQAAASKESRDGKFNNNNNNNNNSDNPLTSRRTDGGKNGVIKVIPVRKLVF